MNRCTIIRGDSDTLVELDVRRCSEDNRARNEAAVGIIEARGAYNRESRSALGKRLEDQTKGNCYPDSGELMN